MEHRTKFEGEHARDTHREGLGDDYARDGGWSGAGRAEDRVREEDLNEDEPRDEVKIGKASE